MDVSLKQRLQLLRQLPGGLTRKGRIPGLLEVRLRAGDLLLPFVTCQASRASRFDRLNVAVADLADAKREAVPPKLLLIRIVVRRYKRLLGQFGSRSAELPFPKADDNFPGATRNLSSVSAFIESFRCGLKSGVTARSSTYGWLLCKFACDGRDAPS